MPKTENKTGRNFSSHANNIPTDYKKVRRDVFHLVEQLICSNTILTASLQHNEVLQKKCLARIQDMKAKIEALEAENASLLDHEQMSDDKIDRQDKIIEQFAQEKHEWLGAKEYRKSKKKEVN